MALSTSSAQPAEQQPRPAQPASRRRLHRVSVGGSTSNTNVRIINNHYSTRYFPKVGSYDIYYYGDGETTGETVSGNVIDETGAPADHNL
jgi:hypothetical protein